MRGNQLKMKNCATQDSLVDFGPVTNRVANNIIKSYNTRYLVGPPFCKNQPLPKQGKIISEDAISYGTFTFSRKISFNECFTYDECFMYVTKTRANTYSRKPENYNGTIIFEIDIMKNSSPINLNLCQN